MNWIECEDGSWINSAHVTRLFVTEDIVADCWKLKASTAGPAHPFTVKSNLPNQATAWEILRNTVNSLHNKEH